METGDKITQLENEIKVLKNEVQAVLLDIRENVLNAENPFSSPKAAATSHQTIIDHQVQTNAPQPVSEPEKHPRTRRLQQRPPRHHLVQEQKPVQRSTL